jgi:hypothetical protein
MIWFGRKIIIYSKLYNKSLMASAAALHIYLM